MSLSPVLFLGEYQLRNLIKGQVQFLYFDLRGSQTRAKQSPDHFYFKNALPVPPDSVVSSVSQLSLAKSHPIVLICEDGEKSMQGARDLEKAGYTNVFVLRGGTDTLDFTKD